MESEWKTKSLKKCGTWRSGGTPSKSKPEYWNGDIPWISAKSLKDFFVEDSEDKITELGLKNGSRLVPKDTILFVVRGMSLKSEFRMGVSLRPVAFNQDLRALEPHDDILPYFLAYAIKAKTLEILDLVGEAGHGTGVLPTDRIQAVQIPDISLHEQRNIVDFVKSLDDKIELNRRMNETLEGMAQALFKSWFVDFDPVIDNALVAGNPIPEELADRAEVRRAALANGTANREAAKPFPAGFQQTEEMGWIPFGWEVSPLIEHVLLTMGQSPPSTFYNTEGRGLPFHQGVTNYGERFPTHVQFSTAGNRYAEQGDVLFSVRAPVGRINISDRKIIVGRGLSAIRHKKNLQAFLVYFLKHTFETEDSIGSGTIFNAVNKKEMENIRFLEPNNTHAMQFDDIAQGFDRKIALNACETEELTKLRDTLLPKLISGELRIPDAEKLAEAALA